MISKTYPKGFREDQVERKMDNDIGAGFNFRLNGFVLQNIGSDQAMSSLCVCVFFCWGGGGGWGGGAIALNILAHIVA